jgi:hypothetical protein
MDTSFTPGPWRVNDLNPYEVYSINPSQRIADCRPNGCICHTEQDRANARLIAAAPELLHALFKIYDEDGLTGQDRIDFIEDIALTAINLATGQ